MKKTFTKTVKKPKVIVMVGPTAVGKSDYAVALAHKLSKMKKGARGAEIISADSRQVYTGLDIGTGKITRKEMRGIPHHLLDVANPRKQFDVEQYRVLGRKALADIIARGKTPIIVGGTGFYIDALVNDTMYPDVKADPKLRAKLAKLSVEKLFFMLKKLDPKRAKVVVQNNSELHNPQRLIRSIEIATALGHVPAIDTKNNSYKIEWIGLNAAPDILRARIHKRLIKRLKNGMIEEAKQLHTNGLSWRRMEALGLEYRYLARHLQHKLTLEQMTTLLETEIWHYAKRQLSWFKRNKKIKWQS